MTNQKPAAQYVILSFPTEVEETERISKELETLRLLVDRVQRPVAIKESMVLLLDRILKPKENTCASCGKPVLPGQDFVSDPLRHAGAECANKKAGQ